MIYLASPYSSPDPAVREARFKAACQAAAGLLLYGKLVFSPIAHSHPLTAYGLGGGFEDWCTWNTWFISRCEELWVLMLDGWKESTGVTAETAIARALGKPTYYVEPSDWGAIHGIEITETS